MTLIYAALTGLVFGLGIVLSGMADPNKVINFFDLFGTWDPSLAFVMGGGLITALIGYRLAFRRSEPMIAGQFPTDIPAQIDGKLVGGSALFGIGWGIAGFCPGGALPALGTLNLYPVAFVLALGGGMGLVRLIRWRGGVLRRFAT